jgi:hypothetical protein
MANSRQEVDGNFGDAYRRFAEQLFTDCALRKEPRGERRTVSLQGQAISYGKRSKLYRGTDFPWRELMAVMAMEKTGLANQNACFEVVSIIWDSRYRYLLLQANRGRKNRVSSSVNQRLQALSDTGADINKLDADMLLLLEQRVKGSANGLRRRLRKRGIDVDRQFRATFGAYEYDDVRSDVGRETKHYSDDARGEWYRRVCERLRKSLVRISAPYWDGAASEVTVIARSQVETELGPHHVVVATHCIHLGRLLQESGQYYEAMVPYLRAWRIVLSDITLSPLYCAALVHAIAQHIGDCVRHRPVTSIPAYSAPRMIRGLLTAAH